MAANVLNNIPINPPFYSFASFSMVSLILFISNPDFSSDPNGKKTLLAKGVSKRFINGKWAAINGLKISRNPPYILVYFQVVPFDKIPLFSKDLIIFIISFILLFVWNIHEALFNLKSF